MGNRCHGIEAHREIVDKCAGVRRPEVKPRMGTRIGERSKAVRVRLGKHEFADSGEDIENLRLNVRQDSFLRHTFDEP